MTVNIAGLVLDPDLVGGPSDRRLGDDELESVNLTLSIQVVQCDHDLLDRKST